MKRARKSPTAAVRKKRLAVILGSVAAFVVFNLLVFNFWEQAKLSQKPGQDPTAKTNSAPPSPIFTPGPSGYFVYQYLPFGQDKTSNDGKLELLLDDQLSNQGNSSMMAIFVKADLNKFKPAVLRTLSGQGKESGRITFALPVANLAGKADLYGDGRPVYQVDQMVRTEAYVKIQTFMVELKKSHLVELPLVLTESHDFGSKLENRWKIVPARGGRGTDLLAFHSDLPPDPQSHLVEMVYTRFFFEGKQWKKREKKKAILPGEDEPFLHLSEFP